MQKIVTFNNVPYEERVRQLAVLFKWHLQHSTLKLERM